MSWDYQYRLPPELIAQTPADPRDSSRLMVINRRSGAVSHHIFRDLPDLLSPPDTIVFNDTKVIPARLYGRKITGGKVEVLLLKQLNSTDWEIISHPGLKPPTEIIFDKKVSAKILSPGTIRFQQTANYQLMAAIGKTPLPPYIHSSASEIVLREQYQTVYARDPGSAAAPTAGLHFTNELISQLLSTNFRLQYLTLHVGLGTFKSPTPEQINSGRLHTEAYSISEQAAAQLNKAKQSGSRIVAVGTTTTRVLESQTKNGILQSGSGETDIFIRPGYQFKFIDGLVTNFHLPATSLLMLISAFASPEIIRHAYEVAVAEKYRFYSFGDACLII